MMMATSPSAASKPATSQPNVGASNMASNPMAASSASVPRKKSRRGADPASHKRRCVSTACIACRKRKSKCDGANPSCAACASVYGTECVYDPNSDHRRKGVYKEKIDSMKAQSSTLQILIEAILNAAEEDVPAIVKRIRTCDSLDAIAEAIAKEERVAFEKDDDDASSRLEDEYTTDVPTEGERDLARKMGELRLENGIVRFIGGTSHLIYTGDPQETQSMPDPEGSSPESLDPLATWTTVTSDTNLIMHLLNMYFAWHYPYFTAISKKPFYRDLLEGKPRSPPTRTTYCSSSLFNAILALGCHFTNVPGAFATPGDSRTKGDHFLAEAKRLIVDNGEYEQPRLTTVQALALMSVLEAGNGREAKGWVYSGMSFRMAQDIGLNLDASAVATDMDDEEIDARRVAYWGCFLFDKCWSNYLGRLPQLPRINCNVPKYDVFPTEDAETWSPYTDSGYDHSSEQPSRVRAVGLHLVKLSEISSDLLVFFYHPNHIGRSSGKSVELKKLSELHRRLEEWRKELPLEFEPKDGQLPNVILVHMFFHLQYIHLFRPFLRYAPENSPLPAHVSPRRICTANAGAISKLMRLYKKTYNLRQIPNIAVYMLHSACTIHMLNLPEKAARRDIIHGVKHLEEMSDNWLCARRTLSIFSVLARKWNIELPAEASIVLRRTDEKYGTFSTADVPSPSVCPNVNTPPAGFGAASSPQNTTAPIGTQNTAPRDLDHNQQYAPVTINRTALRRELQTPQESMHASMHPSKLGGYDSVSKTVKKPSALTQQVPKSVPFSASNPPIASVASNVAISMGDAMGSMNSWGISPISQQQPQAMPAYKPHRLQQQQPGQTQAQALRQQPPHQYSNTMQHNRHGTAGGPAASRGPPSTVGRQVNTQFINALDGNEWFLKDGVNWHQNFETWGLADGVQANAGDQQPTAVIGGAQNGGVGNMHNDPSAMFMFRGSNGMRANEGGIVDVSVFDSLDATMNGLNHLPGLE